MVLYTITSAMTGVYSIAEVVDDSNKRPAKTLLCIIPDGFDAVQVKSLNAVAAMVERNGGIAVYKLDTAATLLNNWQQASA